MAIYKGFVDIFFLTFLVANDSIHGKFSFVLKCFKISFNKTTIFIVEVLMSLSVAT